VLLEIYGTSSSHNTTSIEVIQSSNNAGIALFDVPSHVLPPITTLYKAFMEKLMVTAASPSPMSTEDKMDVEHPLTDQPSGDKKLEQFDNISSTSETEIFTTFFNTDYSSSLGTTVTKKNGTPSKKTKNKQ